MKKPLYTYTYKNRNCPICTSDAIERIKTISATRQGMKYEHYIEAHPLELAEHINHFTPESLTRLMCRAGFELLEISRTHASRKFTFAGVYKKKSIEQLENLFAVSSYVIGKSLLTEGISQIARNRERFQLVLSQLHEMMGVVKNSRLGK